MKNHLCFQFDLPDNCLNAEETQTAADYFLEQLQELKIGEIFTLDIAIGKGGGESSQSLKFQARQRKFKSAQFEKISDPVTEAEVMEFLRQNFDDMLTLPQPKRGLRRVK
jgi:hypothetical protein